MRKRSGSTARGVRVTERARRTTRKIDFSDIPESSTAQLKATRRVGRPPMGNELRQLTAIPVDQNVLDQFRKEARLRRIGYQTLINEVLARYVGNSFARARSSASAPLPLFAASLCSTPCSWPCVAGARAGRTPWRSRSSGA